MFSIAVPVTFARRYVWRSRLLTQPTVWVRALVAASCGSLTLLAQVGPSAAQAAALIPINVIGAASRLGAYLPSASSRRCLCSSTF